MNEADKKSYPWNMHEPDIYEDDPADLSNVQNVSVIAPLGGFQQRIIDRTGLDRATLTSRSGAGSTARSTVQNQNPYKPRILALHGRRSNNDVTRMQMENLKMSEDDYDIFYMKGYVKEDKGNEDIEGIFHGPYYSWYSADGSAGPTLIDAVLDVLKVAKFYGPFDGIYGFSSGAIVAAMATLIGGEPLLLDTLKSPSNGDKKNAKKERRLSQINLGMGRRRSQVMLKSPSMKGSVRSSWGTTAAQGISQRRMGSSILGRESTRGLGQMSMRGSLVSKSMRGSLGRKSTRGLGQSITRGTRGS